MDEITENRNREQSVKTWLPEGPYWRLGWWLLAPVWECLWEHLKKIKWAKWTTWWQCVKWLLSVIVLVYTLGKIIEFYFSLTSPPGANFRTWAIDRMWPIDRTWAINAAWIAGVVCLYLFHWHVAKFVRCGICKEARADGEISGELRGHKNGIDEGITKGRNEEKTVGVCSGLYEPVQTMHDKLSGVGLDGSDLIRGISELVTAWTQKALGDSTKETLGDNAKKDALDLRSTALSTYLTELGGSTVTGIDEWMRFPASFDQYAKCVGSILERVKAATPPGPPIVIWTLLRKPLSQWYNVSVKTVLVNGIQTAQIPDLARAVIKEAEHSFDWWEKYRADVMDLAHKHNHSHQSGSKRRAVQMRRIIWPLPDCESDKDLLVYVKDGASFDTALTIDEAKNILNRLDENNTTPCIKVTESVRAAIDWAVEQPESDGLRIHLTGRYIEGSDAGLHPSEGWWNLWRHFVYCFHDNSRGFRPQDCSKPLQLGEIIAVPTNDTFRRGVYYAEGDPNSAFGLPLEDLFVVQVGDAFAIKLGFVVDRIRDISAMVFIPPQDAGPTLAAMMKTWESRAPGRSVKRS